MMRNSVILPASADYESTSTPIKPEPTSQQRVLYEALAREMTRDEYWISPDEDVCLVNGEVRAIKWWHGADFSEWAVPRDYNLGGITLLVYGYHDVDDQRLTLTTERRTDRNHDLIVWWVLADVSRWVAYMCGLRAACNLLIDRLPQGARVVTHSISGIYHAIGSCPDVVPTDANWTQFLPKLVDPRRVHGAAHG